MELANPLPRPLPRPSVRQLRWTHRHRLRLLAVLLRSHRLQIGPDALLALEKLFALHQAPFMILPSVHKVRIVKRQLGGTVHDVIGGFHAEHKRVILVADLVAPAAEASARVDVFGLEGGEEFGEDAFALEGGGWVAVVEAAVVGRDDFVVRPEHFGVEEALDGFFEEVGVVDGFHARFGDFEHDGPVGTGLGFSRFGGFAGGELERRE